MSSYRTKCFYNLIFKKRIMTLSNWKVLTILCVVLTVVLFKVIFHKMYLFLLWSFYTYFFFFFWISSFIKPARVGETVVIEAKTTRCGRRVAFLSADIRSKDGQLLAQGFHTKLLMGRLDILYSQSKICIWQLIVICKFGIRIFVEDIILDILH